MTRSRAALWLWMLRLVIPAGLTALWVMTAGPDVLGSLWRTYSPPVAYLNVVITLPALALWVALMGRARSIGTRVARAALVCISTAVLIVVLEIPALVFGYDYRRVFGTVEADSWLQLATGVQRADPELISVHRPHTRYRGAVTGNLVSMLGIPSPARYHVDVAYDRNGFRNDADLTAADVAVIGDSFVEGAETPRPDTMVAQLGSRLGATVANLGQSNYGPQQELVVLERYGLPLAPKVVVWVFFGGNDLENVTEYEEQHAHQDELTQPPPLRKRLLSRNALEALARLTTPDRRTATDEARRHAVQFTHADGTTETLYLDREEGPWLPHQWDIASDVLRRAHDAAQHAGAGFLLVYVPRKLSVYRDFLTAAPDAYANTWPVSGLPDALRDWSRGQGIEFLDATVPLREAVSRGESVHLSDDVHWNAAGHRVVAAAVAERIRPWLHAATGTTPGPVE